MRTHAHIYARRKFTSRAGKFPEKFQVTLGRDPAGEYSAVGRALLNLEPAQVPGQRSLVYVIYTALLLCLYTTTLAKKKKKKVCEVTETGRKWNVLIYMVVGSTATSGSAVLFHVALCCVRRCSLWCESRRQREARLNLAFDFSRVIKKFGVRKSFRYTRSVLFVLGVFAFFFNSCRSSRGERGMVLFAWFAKSFFFLKKISRCES